MKRSVIFAISFLMLGVLTDVARCQNAGQEDLNEATKLQATTRSMQEVERVIELCESALKKGLDETNREFAEQLIVSSLWQHGSRFASQIFDTPQPHPQWPVIRRVVLADLEKLLQYDDSFREAHVLIARLESLPEGNREKGLRAANRAVELAADDPRGKSEALLSRAGLREDAEDTLADLDAAIQADPTHAKAWQSRAQHYIRAGKIEEAIADFEKLLEADSDNVAARRALAQTLAALKRYDLALEQLGTAIELAPQQVLNYTLRAEVREEQEEYKAAIEDLNTAIEIQPDNAKALLARARLNFMVDNLQAAKDDIQRVLERDPSPQALHIRSMIAAATRDFRQAAEDLQKLVAANPDEDALKLQLANVYVYDQRPRKAIEILDQVIQSDPMHWLARRSRADALLSVGKHKEAIADYTAALEGRPEDDLILNNLAWVLATSPRDELRDGERAVELATKACEVTEYQRPHILSTLAAAYAESGNFEKAIEWSSQAVEKGKTEMQDQLEQLEQELKSYRDAKPWREMQEIKDKPEPPRRVIET